MAGACWGRVAPASSPDFRGVTCPTPARMGSRAGMSGKRPPNA